jgi:hypothetical protein
MAKAKTTGNKKTRKKVAVGIGLATLAAAAAGTYFLYGTKEGAKRRKQIRGWTLRMKGEILEKMENLKDMSEDAYNRIVDQVADKYKKAKNVDAAELAALVGDVKRHWKNIKSHLTEEPKKKRVSRKTKAA